MGKPRERITSAQCNEIELIKVIIRSKGILFHFSSIPCLCSGFSCFFASGSSLQLFRECSMGFKSEFCAEHTRRGDIVVAQPLIDEAWHVFGIVVVLKDLSFRWHVAACAAGGCSGTWARPSCPGFGWLGPASHAQRILQFVYKHWPKILKKSNIKKTALTQIITAGCPKRDTIVDTKCLQ